MRTLSRVFAGVSAVVLSVVGLSSGVASADDSDAWGQLVSDVGALSAGQGEFTIDSDASIAEGSDPLVVHEGANVTLVGSGDVTGLGTEAIKVERGGQLNLAGPSFKDVQIVVEGALNFTAGSIHDTAVVGPVLFVNGGTLTISDAADFSNNSVADESSEVLIAGVNATDYSPITAYDATVNISGGTLRNNVGLVRGGALGVWGRSDQPTTLSISGGEITENVVSHPTQYGYGAGVYAHSAIVNISGGIISKNATERGGGLALEDCITTFTGGTVSENSNGEYKGNGGGVFVAGGSLTVHDATIENNTANGPGGGIYASDLVSYGADGKPLKDEDGNNIFTSPQIEIFNVSLVGNESLTSGAGAALVGHANTSIHGASISGNTSKGFWGGAGIYNDTHATLTISNALIRNNVVEDGFMIGAGKRPPSQQGGGVWNCPTGSSVINVTNGVAIFENSASDRTMANGSVYYGAGDDFASIRTHEFDNHEPVNGHTVTVHPRMLGGGKRAWYQDGSIYSIHTNWPESDQVPRYSAGKPVAIPFNELIGDNIAFKSVPTDDAKALAEQLATVRIEGNRATRTGISGAGIANNGKLIFGTDDDWSIAIEKAWSSDIPQQRPEAITLDVLVADHVVDTVELTKDNGWKATLEQFPNPDSLVDAATGEVLPLTFKEHGADGYTLSVVERDADDGTRTYSVKLENQITTQIPVEKIWEGDAETDRPESIKVNLIADGEETDQVLELNAENDWKGAFQNLPKYKLVTAEGEEDQIVEIEYSVSEVDVEGYTSELSGNAVDGFVLTNTRDVPPTTEPSEPSEPTQPTEPTTPTEPTNPTETEPTEPYQPEHPRTGTVAGQAAILGALLLIAGTGLVYVRRRN